MGKLRSHNEHSHCQQEERKHSAASSLFHCLQHLLGTVKQVTSLHSGPAPRDEGSWPRSDHTCKAPSSIMSVSYGLLKCHGSQGWVLVWDPFQMAIFPIWVFLILKFSSVDLWCFMSLFYEPTSKSWIQNFSVSQNQLCLCPSPSEQWAGLTGLYKVGSCYSCQIMSPHQGVGMSGEPVESGFGTNILVKTRFW